MYLEQLKAETQTEEGVVAHVCNLSTLETWDRRIISSRPA
jgi:hypothetical protein